VLRRLTVLACLVGLVLALVYALGRSTDPIVGSNGIPPAVFPVDPLRAGSVACDGLGTSVDRADALQLTVGAEGANPPLRVTLDGGRGSRTVSGYEDGVVAIPLPTGVDHGASSACIRNLGPSPVLLGGAVTGANQGGTVDGTRTSFSLSLRLVRFDAPDWSSAVGRTVERIGHGRGGSGAGWSGWLVVALFASAFGAALAGAWRWAR